jgi:hypothetical protein
VQHADLDCIVGGNRTVEGSRCRYDGAKCCAPKGGFEIHMVDPLFLFRNRPETEINCCREDYRVLQRKNTYAK